MKEKKPLTEAGKVKLIDKAIWRLSKRGITLPEVIAWLAGKNRPYGSYRLAVQTGPKEFMVYIDGNPTKTDSIRAAGMLFMAAVPVPGFEKFVRKETLNTKPNSQPRRDWFNR